MGNHIVIHGYYGADNAGDEAILAAIIDALSEQAEAEELKNPEITVLSRDPEATKVQHGVNSVYTGRMLSGLGKVISTIYKSQGFITGGGGLLQDRHARIVPYWLSRVVLAKLLRKPVVFYAQGVGPIYRPFSKILMRWILPRLDVITVRDVDSKNLLVNLGIPKDKIQVTADPAFALKSSPWEDVRKKISKCSYQIDLDDCADNRWIGVSLRPWQENEQNLTEIAAYLDELAAKGMNILFVPMQFQPDLEISQRVRNMMESSQSTAILDYPLNPREISTVLSYMDFNIAMRLHAAIFSMKSAVPTLGLSYQPKVEGVFREMGQDNWVFGLNQISVESLTAATEEMLAEKNYIKEQLYTQAYRLEKLAMRTAELTLDCLP